MTSSEAQPPREIDFMPLRTGHWGPHRDEYTDASGGWTEFLERLDLQHWTKITVKKDWLKGQDGWAFNVAMRFQSIACDLEKERPAYYWSSYYLLALIIQKTRCNMALLEAVEVVATAFLAGGLKWRDVVEQLKQMDIWP